jgi:hypothetical protein
VSDVLDPIVEALREASRTEPSPFRLATVTGTAGGGVQVIFDGEGTASTKSYRRLESATGLLATERVLMAKVGTSWVVLGQVV